MERLGKRMVQVFEAREGQEMVVAVGGGAGAGDGPEVEETVIDDVEGFGLVAEVVLAMRSGAQFGIPVEYWGWVRAGWSRSSRHRRPGDRGRWQSGSVAAGGGIAGAAFLASQAGRARARAAGSEQAGTWWMQSSGSGRRSAGSRWTE